MRGETPGQRTPTRGLNADPEYSIKIRCNTTTKFFRHSTAHINRLDEKEHPKIQKKSHVLLFLPLNLSVCATWPRNAFTQSSHKNLKEAHAFARSCWGLGDSREESAEKFLTQLRLLLLPHNSTIINGSDIYKYLKEELCYGVIVTWTTEDTAH